VSLLIKILAVTIPLGVTAIKARLDFVVANKRVSHEKKVALRRAYKTVSWGCLASGVLLIIAMFLEKVDARRSDQLATKRHDEIHRDLAGLRAAMTDQAQIQQNSRSKEFELRYPQGYALFSVAEPFVSEEMRHWDSNVFKADWDTAAVRILTSNSVTFVPPAFHVGTGPLTPDGGISYARGDINFGGGTATTLPRSPGVTMNWASIGLGVNARLQLSTNLKVVIEVATNRPMGVTMILGTKKLVEPYGKPSAASFSFREQ